MLGAAAVVVLVAALASRGPSTGAAEATEAFDRLLGWLEPLWSAADGAAVILVVVLVVGAIAARRWALTRDLVLAARERGGRRPRPARRITASRLHAAHLLEVLREAGHPPDIVAAARA